MINSKIKMIFETSCRLKHSKWLYTAIVQNQEEKGVGNDP